MNRWVVQRTTALLILATLAAVSGGCRKKDASMSAVQGIKAQPLADLTLPKELLCYGGTTNLQQAAETLAAFASNVHPLAAGLPALVERGLQQQLGLAGAASLDFSRPLRFALFEPEHDAHRAVALIIGIKSKAAFAAALPASRKTNVEGNAYAWGLAPRPTTYANFVDQSVVITYDQQLFSQQRSFFFALARSKIDRTLAVVLAARNVHALYGTQITRGVQRVLEQTKQQRSPSGTLSSPAAEASLVTGILGVMGETEQLRLELNMTSAGAALRLILRPRPKTAMERTFVALPPPAGALPLLRRYPAGTPLFVAMRVVPGALNGLTKRLVEMLVALVPSGDGPASESVRAVGDLWKAGNGEAILAYTAPPGSTQLRLSAVYGLENAKYARSLVPKLFAFQRARDYRQLLAKRGLTPVFEPRAYRIDGVPVAVARVEPARRLRSSASKTASPADGSALPEVHLATTETFGVVAYGSGAREMIENVLAGATPSLEQDGAAKRVFDRATPGSFLWTYVRPMTLLRPMLGAAAVALGLGAGPTGVEPGLALSAGVHDGELSVMLRMPADEARRLGQLWGAVTTAFGSSWQNLQPQMP